MRQDKKKNNRANRFEIVLSTLLSYIPNLSWWIKLRRLSKRISFLAKNKKQYRQNKLKCKFISFKELNTQDKEIVLKEDEVAEPLTLVLVENNKTEENKVDYNKLSQGYTAWDVGLKGGFLYFKTKTPCEVDPVPEKFLD